MESIIIEQHLSNDILNLFQAATSKLLRVYLYDSLDFIDLIFDIDLTKFNTRD